MTSKKEPLPSNPVPVNTNVKISPPVSTVSTVILISLVVSEPPTLPPPIIILSPTA